jgi:hypothetical protein
VFAGASNSSFAQAEQALRHLAEIDISDKQVRRVCAAIGSERVAERDGAAADYAARPLTERKQAPPGVTAPAVAVVSVDGGRLQILERVPGVARKKAKPAAAVPLALLAAGAAATLPPPDAQAAALPLPEEEIEDDVAVPAPPRAGKKPLHWREDKIGLLLTMQSTAYAVDPCPQIPESFVNPHWIAELAKEMSRQGPVRDLPERATGPPTDTATPTPDAAAAAETWKPKVLGKELVGTRRPWAAFGPLVAAQAWLLGYFGASRRGFVADGAETNWTLWREHFSSFTPILDFIHALTYVFHAALAGRSAAEGWTIYQRWIGWVWSGDVAQTIAELAQRQAELGLPAAEASPTSAAAIVSRALGYLQHHQERMRYADYRRAGLPIVSSYVESAVKQFNARVKGTEKFWRESGAEALLQLRADLLSDSDRLGQFWQRRQARESGQARYRRAA